MKNKLSYSLGIVIGLILMYGVYRLIWMIFKRITPEHAFIAEKLFTENVFIILFLLLMAYPIEVMWKSHKNRHQKYLNKLAEIEWLEQYGDDGRVR